MGQTTQQLEGARFPDGARHVVDQAPAALYKVDVHATIVPIIDVDLRHLNISSDYVDWLGLSV
jgi:hypothetical protein